MATSITQKPNQLAASNSPMVFVVSESASGTYGGFKFRYILKIEINGTLQAVIKTHKNGANVGIFDISKVVNSYIETQLSNANSTSNPIHSIGVQEGAKPFSQNTNQCAKVEVKVFYEVATSATTAPEESSEQASATFYATPATTPFTKTATNIGGLDVNGGQYPLSYFLNSTSTEDSHSFFTNAPNVQFVRGGNLSSDNTDLLTVCFKQEGLITDGVDIDYMFVEYFNSSGVAIAGTAGSATWYALPNSTTSGGATVAQSTSVGTAILYFGCGTRNLQAQAIASVIDSEGATVGGANARPSNHTDWAYYRIYGSTDATQANRCTKYYYFYRYGTNASVDDRHQSCTRNNNIRLAWVNRLGSWDYMNFRGKSVESVDIKRTEISNVPGTWNSSTFSYNSWEGGRSGLFTDAKRKLTINSDWLNDNEAAWLEELFTSNTVQIIDDEETVVYPVLVTDKSYTKKNSLNNKIKVQYSIKLEYANNIRTNN